MSDWFKGIGIVLSMWYFANAMVQLFITKNTSFEMIYITASAVWLGYALRKEK